MSKQLDSTLCEIFKNGWTSSQVTVCGYGSEINRTNNIRRFLSILFQEYQQNNDVLVLNDIGCGDRYWIDMILLSCVDYIGYDYFLRKPGVVQLDICTETPRMSELTICRDVFIHLPNDMIVSALQNIKKTTSWLISTSFLQCDNYSRENTTTLYHQKLDLCLDPFNLGPAFLNISEDYPNKYLGLWRLGE